MDPLVQERLQELNRHFYEEHADAFSASRRAPWPGWSSLSGIETAKRVVDVGCGNGRYLKFLQARSFEGSYIGIDGCASLLEIARSTYGESSHVAWHHSQLSGLPTFEGCDYVVAWGLLHHVPGFEARLTLLQEMLSWTTPDGAVCFSLWQFRHHTRFASHELDPERFGFTPDQLEEGDALLDWQGNTDVPRYCHHFSDEEIARLVACSSDLHFERQARQTESDRFNAYLTLRRAS